MGREAEVGGVWCTVDLEATMDADLDTLCTVVDWTCNDLLTLERHGARTVPGIRERILQRFLCLAACIVINHHLGRPSRALVESVA